MPAKASAQSPHAQGSTAAETGLFAGIARSYGGEGETGGLIRSGYLHILKHHFYVYLQTGIFRRLC